MNLNIKQYLEILQRHILIIILVTVLTMIVVLAAALQIKPVYEAQATVRILQNSGPQQFGLGIEYGETLMNTYQYVLTSWNTLSEAANRLGRGYLPASLLSNNLKVEVVPNSELITISFKNEDPLFARDFANMLAVMLIEYNENSYQQSGPSSIEILQERLQTTSEAIESDRTELVRLITERGNEGQIEALRSRIDINETSYSRLLELYEQARLDESVRAKSVSVVEYAIVPTRPSNSFSFRQIILSLVAGLFGGIALALILENLDTRIRNRQQLEQVTDMPIIGTVPRGLLSVVVSDKSSKLPGKIRASRNGASARGYREIEEAYKVLNVNLQRLKETKHFNTVLITSTRSHEGKTNVAVNLSYMASEGGNTVFLLESDMRSPSIGKRLDLNSDIGLANFLSGLSPMSDTIQPTDRASLFVVSSGPTPANPSALLASPFMDDVIDYFGSQAQMTLIDAPPVLGTADVSILAPKVDGVILVVGQELVNRDQVREALKQLEAAHANVLGIVFLQKSKKDWGYN